MPYAQRIGSLSARRRLIVVNLNQAQFSISPEFEVGRHGAFNATIDRDVDASVVAKVCPEQAWGFALAEVGSDRLNELCALRNLRRDAGDNLACARKCRVEPP